MYLFIIPFICKQITFSNKYKYLLINYLQFLKYMLELFSYFKAPRTLTLLLLLHHLFFFELSAKYYSSSY